MKKNSNSNVMTGLFLQSHFTFHQMNAKMEALKNKWTDRWVRGRMSDKEHKRVSM